MESSKNKHKPAKPVNENEPDYAMMSSILNPDDGSLPFGYYSPELDGKVTWKCGTDQEGKIISVFCYDDRGVLDKKIAVLPSMKDAVYAKDQLVEAGWLKIKPPEITVKQADGSDKPINREQKRKLQKNLKKMEKDNPFEK